MASQERTQLISLELTIESVVRRLPNGQASQVRTRIWNSMVAEARGIVNLIEAYSRPPRALPSVEQGRRHVSSSPLPQEASHQLAELKNSL